MNVDTPSSSPSRVVRIRHELKRRPLEVVRVARPSPHLVSVTFGGEALADFVSASFDDHVKLVLDTGGAEPVMRDYTPRAFDAAARELTIEFALHGDGPAAAWAARAEPGDRATIGGPRGSFVVPTDLDWHLLIGDETALPAIARRLEELPAATRAIVWTHARDRADRRAWRTAATLEARWFDDADALREALVAFERPAGEGYAWCAGEAAETAALRRLLVDERGHDRHAIRAAAYWKRGTAAHHENLEG